VTFLVIITTIALDCHTDHFSAESDFVISLTNAQRSRHQLIACRFLCRRDHTGHCSLRFAYSLSISLGGKIGSEIRREIEGEMNKEIGEEIRGEIGAERQRDSWRNRPRDL
jgi:hypothetical protein